MVVRTISVAVVHQMDRAAETANFRMIEVWQLIAIALQGLRIAIPAMALCFIPANVAWLTDGMSIGGGMVVAVGYAMVINMMATPEVWPFLIIGFCLAAIGDLTLIALGAIGICIALIYLKLSENTGVAGAAAGTGDPLGDTIRSAISWMITNNKEGGTKKWQRTKKLN